MNVFDLAAKLVLDKKDYDKGLDDAEGKADGVGSKIGAALGKTAKVAAVGLTTAAGAAGALLKQSVEAFADYEQLTGGVETMFKKSSDTIMQFAENAYKTAGMSANNYMETVTSFSAALIGSLGGDTEKAAKYADMAITDMSDNANKMGTDMEAIENAYMGFSKQNYTMLDNLKLGYGGTKEEMKRLLSDAEKLSGQKFDLSSYADIVQAIHIVQENMGIAGTTAKEASETISGSIGMTKAAWENLVAGISNPDADIGALISDLVSSAGTAIGNLFPVIETALTGLGETVTQLAPQLSDTIISLVTTAAPTLIDSAFTMIETLVNALIDNLPTIMETGLQVLLSLTMGIAENLPVLIPSVVEAIMTIADTLTKPDNLKMILTAGIELLAAILAGLWEAMPRLIDGIKKMFVNVGTLLGEKAAELYLKAADWVSAKWDAVKTWGKDLIDNFIAGIKEKFQNVKDAFKELGNIIKDLIGFSEPKEGPLSNFHTFAPDMVDLFIEGINSKKDELYGAVSSAFDFSDAMTAPQYSRGNVPHGRYQRGGASEETAESYTASSSGDISDNVANIAKIMENSFHDQNGVLAGSLQRIEGYLYFGKEDWRIIKEDQMNYVAKGIANIEYINLKAIQETLKGMAAELKSIRTMLENGKAKAGVNILNARELQMQNV